MLPRIDPRRGKHRGVCAITLGDDPELLVRELQDRFPRAELVGGDAKFERLVANVLGWGDAPKKDLAARWPALPLDVRGTAFPPRVWKAPRLVTSGQTMTHAELAAKIGAPKAVRAAAMPARTIRSRSSSPAIASYNHQEVSRWKRTPALAESLSGTSDCLSGRGNPRVMPSRSKSFAPLAAGFVVLALAGIGWRFLGNPESRSVPGAGASSADTASTTSSTAPARARENADASPHAHRDPVKREEVRQRLLAAMAEAQRQADEEKAAANAGSLPDPNARGNREPNDLKEFGSFVSQAIKEDFMPMAQACAKELAVRQPDAGGSVRVAFKLLGDKKIGGVVDEAKVEGGKSTLHDDKFETCMRESMYGVYFDPPPFGGEATLNFDVGIKGDGQGGIESDDLDFSHIKDRRNEKPE